MKTRNGFVSNSSSASFVIVGWLFDRDKVTRKEIMEEVLNKTRLDEFSTKVAGKNWNELDEFEQDDVFYELSNSPKYHLSILDHEEMGAPQGKTVVGRMLLPIDSEDWGAEQTILPLSDLKYFLDEFPYSKNEAVIMTGTMMT